jgi:hypothetical protein
LRAKKERYFGANDLAGRLANLANGRDEMNLCELPFATLSERNTHREMLRFVIEDYDHDLGRIVNRTLTVKGDPEFGLPTEKDEEIYLGLLKYSSDYNGFSDPQVRLSRSALFELMGWPKSDWAYRRLTKGMHRLVGVRLSYQKLWRDNRNKEWRDQGAFGIVDSFEFRDRRSVGRNGSFTEQTSAFRWGSVLFQSFDTGYLKRIDYGLARSLSPTARRLYRYLDKQFHPPRKTKIEIDLSRLAHQHIGLSPGIELDKVRKRHIGPAAEELEGAGYLRKPKSNRFEKLRRGVWNAVFELAERQNSKDRPEHQQNREMVQALCRRGVSTATSLAFLASYKQDSIEQAIRAMDAQLRSGSVIRSPDRWLKAALKNGYRADAATERAALRPERRLFRRDRLVG